MKIKYENIIFLYIKYYFNFFFVELLMNQQDKICYNIKTVHIRITKGHEIEVNFFGA